MAAGVRSIISAPCEFTLAELALCAYAEVASKQICTPSARIVGNMPSTPSEVVLRPISFARARPGDCGSTPTIHTGSISVERFAFISRSVPMLPGPMMAALILLPMYSSIFKLSG